MFGYFILSVLVAIPVSVIAEIALLSNNIVYRPSWAIAKTGTGLRWSWFQMYYWLFLITDVGRFIKRFALFVRDVFFHFIPREVIVKAVDDLWKSLGVLVRSPYGMVEGFLAGLKEVRVPCLSASLVVIFNLFTFVVVPVITEVVLFVSGYETRPTTILRSAAAAIYEHAKDTTFGLRYLWDWKDAVVAFVSRFCAWIAPEIIKNATSTLYKEAGNLVTSPARGALAGLCMLFKDVAACNEYLPAVLFFAGSAVIIIGLLFALYWLSPPRPQVVVYEEVPRHVAEDNRAAAVRRVILVNERD